jgi:hypothetical protein
VYIGQDGILRGTNGYCIKSGLGNEMLIGYFDDPKIKIQWFIKNGTAIKEEDIVISKRAMSN